MKRLCAKLLCVNSLLLLGRAEAAVAPAAGGLTLAWQDADRAPETASLLAGSDAFERRPLPSEEATPRGSLWKLFVYFYLSENGLTPSPYACTGASSEEAFCCKLGQSIDLDQALARSCGLYFAPQRAGIDKFAWAGFWRGRMGLSYAWLLDLDTLPSGGNIPVRELLDSLTVIRRKGGTFSRLNSALEHVVIEGTGRGNLRRLGSLYRVKTFTEKTSGPEAGFVGGFAGWLSQGQAVWAYGSGTSAEILAQWSRKLALFAQGFESRQAAQSVEVHFFTRYPVKDVVALPSGAPAGDGPLSGRFRVLFENGRSLDFSSAGDIILSSAGGRRHLRGLFRIDDYVARVLDREFQPSPAEAARAMAVAVRTYLFQNAAKRGGLLVMEDSTHAQRVSINPPGEEALRVARWSDQLVLSGVADLRYHQWKSGQGLLSWSRAKELAGSGYYFDQILRDAWPQGRLGVTGETDAVACRRLPDAEDWLRKHADGWTARLGSLPGFEAPADVQVCGSAEAVPYTDLQTGRIFMRFSREREDQLTAAHEYLHLAFKRHPSGDDERFLDKLAHELVLEDGSGTYEDN